MIDYSEAIEERLQHLAGLPPGWDSYGGLPISPQVIETARAVIREITAAGGNLPMPYIAPCGDGTLSVEWAMPDGSELIVDVPPLADGRVEIRWVRTDVLGDINCAMSALGQVIRPLMGRET